MVKGSVGQQIEAFENLLRGVKRAIEEGIAGCIANTDFGIIREHYQPFSRKGKSGTYRYHCATIRGEKHKRVHWFGAIDNPYANLRLDHWRQSRYISNLFFSLMKEMKRTNHELSILEGDLKRFKEERKNRKETFKRDFEREMIFPKVMGKPYKNEAGVGKNE